MRTLLILVLLALPSFSQESLEIGEPQQVTYFEADSAELLKKGDKTLILAEGLSEGQKRGVLLPIENPVEEYITVFVLREINGQQFAVFPPKSVPHLDGDPSRFLIEGSPGESFGIQIPGSNPPAYLSVKIDGPPTPPLPPPSDGLTSEDITSITEITISAVNFLQDPVTQSELKKAFTELYSSLPGNLEEAEATYNQAFSKAMIEAASKVNPPYKDWRSNFREQIKQKYNLLESKITDSDEFSKFLNAIIAGL